MNPRIVGYDVARAVAILAMVVVNFHVMMASCEAEPEWLAWAIDVLYGRAAALFVVLSGAGVSLMSLSGRRAAGGSRSVHEIRGRLTRRGLALFFGGLVLMEWWAADILHVYGLLLLIGAILIKASDQWLWGITAFFAAGSIAVLNISEEMLFSDFLFSPIPGPIQPAWLLDDLLISGVYPVFPWAAFFVLGMWLGRKDLSRPEFRRNLMIAGSAIFFMAIAASQVCERLFLGGVISAETESPAFWFDMQPFPNTPFFTLSAGAGALIVILACVMVTDRAKDRAWRNILAETGRMSLSLYILHIVFALNFLDHPAFASTSPTAADVVTYAAGFCAVAIFFSHGWLNLFHQGPLEWVMRTIGTLRLPPRRKMASPLNNET